MASPSVKPNAQRVIRIDYNDYLRPARLTQFGYAPTPDGGFKRVQRAQRFIYDNHRHLITIEHETGVTRDWGQVYHARDWD